MLERLDPVFEATVREVVRHLRAENKRLRTALKTIRAAADENGSDVNATWIVETIDQALAVDRHAA